MRTILTVLAIALSVSLVVAVTSGFSSMEATARRVLNDSMGAADATVTAASGLQNDVPEDLLAALLADGRVRSAVGRLEAEGILPRRIDPKAPKRQHEFAVMPEDKINCALVGVRFPDDEPVKSIPIISGRWFDAGNPAEAVIDDIAAQKADAGLGQTIELPTATKDVVRLMVVGIVHKPTLLAEHGALVYLPLGVLQKLERRDNPPEVSRILIQLRGGVDAKAFEADWHQRLAARDAGLKLKLRSEIVGGLDQHLRGLRLLSYMSGAASMLTATFIIFSALSMGITERQRTLAMMRAIGATRGQVAKLVLLEGLFISLLGIAVGVPAGMLWVTLLKLRFTDLFPAGIIFSMGGIGVASATSLLSAVAASMLPAYTASRVSPVQAMNAHGADAAGQRIPWKAALAGLLLIGIDPYIFYGLWPAMAQGAAGTLRLWLHFALGLPMLMLGFFLLAPLFVWTLEKILAPLVAFILVVPIGLLRQQLSGGLWRAAGTAAALMVGLSSLVVMQVQGHTVIGGWRLPTKFPDIFIFGSELIPWKDIDQLQNLPGIQSGRLMPVVITTPSGDSSVDLLAGMASLGPKNPTVMFFGVNPAQALDMVELEFRDNDGVPYPPEQQTRINAEVAAEMAKGRRIIVTDQFRAAKHTKIGDTIRLLTRKNGMQDYTVAAIAWSPGVDVLVSMFDMSRMFDQQTVGSVFGTLQDAATDFGATGVRLFAADLMPGEQKETLMKNLQKQLGERGLRAGDTRVIKANVERGFYHILMLISSVAFAAMTVASLGVTNAIMASVRSRRWQFGVLRSVGVLRGQLLRLVICEAVMLGLIAMVLGLAAGFEMSIDARQLSGTLLGYMPPMVIPWPALSVGVAVVMVISLLASLWPAISVARTPPLVLLQGGRAST